MYCLRFLLIYFVILSCVVQIIKLVKIDDELFYFKLEYWVKPSTLKEKFSIYNSNLKFTPVSPTLPPENAEEFFKIHSSLIGQRRERDVEALEPGPSQQRRERAVESPEPGPSYRDDSISSKSSRRQRDFDDEELEEVGKKKKKGRN